MHGLSPVHSIEQIADTLVLKGIIRPYHHLRHARPEYQVADDHYVQFVLDKMKTRKQLFAFVDAMPADCRKRMAIKNLFERGDWNHGRAYWSGRLDRARRALALARHNACHCHGICSYNPVPLPRINIAANSGLSVEQLQRAARITMEPAFVTAPANSYQVTLTYTTDWDEDPY